MLSPCTMILCEWRVAVRQAICLSLYNTAAVGPLLVLFVTTAPYQSVFGASTNRTAFYLAIAFFFLHRMAGIAKSG